MAIEAGDPAPDFALTDDQGAIRKLSDYRGNGLVLYFYPKAFTPGCTTQACDFRDRYQTFRAAGFEIAGVSPDPPERLAAFRAEHGLPFALLSDPDHAVAEAYGAWGPKKLYGKETIGLIRSTVVVDPDGRVASARHNVRAKGHAERLADELA